MPAEPTQFTTADGSLIGSVDGVNNTFSFQPIPTLYLYAPRPGQAGSLLFRNGLLVDEYGDYAAGQGFYLLTSPLS
jgi:hypothetical protein